MNKPTDADDGDADFLADGKHLILVRGRTNPKTEQPIGNLRVVTVPVTALQPDPNPSRDC